MESHDPIRKSLRKLNARIKSKLIQDDHYFTPPLLSTSEKGSIVRIREETHEGYNRRVMLSYKSPNKPVAGVEAREEIELEVLSSVGALTDLLKRIKVTPIVSVKKERVEYALTYKNVDFTVTLDKVDTLGLFVEIELVSSEKDDVQKLAILGEELARKLGIDISRKIDLGYHELVIVSRNPRL